MTNLIKINLVLFIVLFQFACSTGSKRTTDDSSQSGDIQEQSSSESISESKPITQYQPVTLIFGPGLAKTFSYAGVLKAFSQQKIPIKGIVATEFGAVVAGIYATSRSINEFEWKLTKFRKKAFPKNAKDSSFLKNPTSVFFKALNQALVGKRIESSRVKVAFGAYPTSNSEFSILNRGSMIQAVKGSLGVPGFIYASRWKGRSSYSSSNLMPYPVQWVKDNWGGPVIVISVTEPRVEYRYQVSQEEVDYRALSAMSHRQSKEQLEMAELVIEPRLNDIHHYDFSKIHSIIFRGRQKILSNMYEIKSLLEVK